MWVRGVYQQGDGMANKSQYIRQSMGQQDSRPQLSLKTSPRNINYHQPSHKPPTRTAPPARRVECEGVLKLQSTPFKNCIEIQTEQEILFLEAVELTLRQLLEGRLHTNKLFLGEDIDRLIEGVIYALAHLQTHGITYKDIDPQNIFYDQGNFKLLPNQLICLNTYQKLREGTPVLPSPELIIALRCGQEEVVQQDILEKSNVFTLGMVLLEVCTLLPSEDCYDCDNYDILDSVINQRVLLVEEYYGERVAKIVANMLDYDYTERMNLKDLSIWVNRQLATSKAESDGHVNPPLPTHPTAPQSVAASKVERTDARNNQGGVQKSRSRLAKNNSVYMNVPKEDGGREERNKIYINDTAREEPPRVFVRGQAPANRHYRMETAEKPTAPMVPERFMIGNQSLNESDTYKFNESLPLRERPQNHPYQVNQDYRAAPPKREPAFERSLLDRDTVTKRITKEPARPFRGQPEELQKASSSGSSGNQYYPNIDEILKNKPQLLRGIRGPSESSSLSRIKSQIERSKKLVEQIKQNEIRS